jgi:hypothetical protein
VYAACWVERNRWWKIGGGGFFQSRTASDVERGADDLRISGVHKEKGVLGHWTWRPPAFAYNFYPSGFGSENFATPAPLPSPRDCCSPRYYLLGAYDYLEESVDYHI